MKYLLILIVSMNTFAGDIDDYFGGDSGKVPAENCSEKFVAKKFLAYKKTEVGTPDLYELIQDRADEICEYYCGGEATEYSFRSERYQDLVLTINEGRFQYIDIYIKPGHLVGWGTWHSFSELNCTEY